MHIITVGTHNLDIKKFKLNNSKQVKCQYPMDSFFNFINREDIKHNNIGLIKEKNG